METYRYGKWTSTRYIDEGVEFYSVDKKTFFGWKEIAWWHINDEGYKRMMEAVEQLKKSGHLVLQNRTNIK